MFKDLKEYQEITRIYHESVNISEEQRAINNIFIEEGFTLEEIEFLEENFDELWENELAALTEDYVVESLSQENLNEEQINEVLGLVTGARLAMKANKGLTKLAKKAAPAIKKGLGAAKTGIKDTARGAVSVGKSALKKVGSAIKKAAPFAAKVALPFGLGAGLVGGINALRKRGKAEREAKTNTAGEAAGKGGKQAQAGGGVEKTLSTAGGSQAGAKAGQAAAEVIKSKTTKDAGKTAGTAAKTVTPETKPKMSSIEKKNRARFGDSRVDKLKAKQVDFKAYKKGEMTKDEFIKKYPKSITAQQAAGLRDHTEWDAYDMVLEYLFSTEQVESLEEANYVMMEMDQGTIGEIVREVKGALIEEGSKKMARPAGAGNVRAAVDASDSAKSAVGSVVSKAAKDAGSAASRQARAKSAVGSAVAKTAKDAGSSAAGPGSKAAGPGSKAAGRGAKAVGPGAKAGAKSVAGSKAAGEQGLKKIKSGGGSATGPVIVGGEKVKSYQPIIVPRKKK